MTDTEKIKKLEEMLKEYYYDPNFDFKIKYWDNGNFDDSYEYGVDSGKQDILGIVKRILDS